MPTKCAALVLITSLIGGCSGVATPPAGHVLVTDASPITQKMAVLEHGGGREVPIATVEAFNSTFLSLERKCVQRRDSAQGRAGLADMSVAAVQGLRKKGRKTGYLEFIQAMDTSVPPEMKGPIDCAEIAALLAVLLDN